MSWRGRSHRWVPHTRHDWRQLSEDVSYKKRHFWMCMCMSEDFYSQSLFASCLSGHRQICLLRQKGFVIFCSYWIIFHKLTSKKYLLDCLGARWPNFRARWDLFVEWSPLMSSLSSLFSTSFRTLLLGTSCQCPCGFVAPDIKALVLKQLPFVTELVDVTFVYTSEMFLKMANCIFFASVQSKSPLEPNRGLGASLSWEKVLRLPGALIAGCVELLYTGRLEVPRNKLWDQNVQF